MEQDKEGNILFCFPPLTQNNIKFFAFPFPWAGIRPSEICGKSPEILHLKMENSTSEGFKNLISKTICIRKISQIKGT